jgi:hypothetical protein
VTQLPTPAPSSWVLVTSLLRLCLCTLTQENG